ncbi:LysR family transcriptional regulator [Oxalobacteraceae bacterium OM1]|nr:LysR family transcriptional regulator [Oxalobacteraceae bacterium OM1]
MREPADIDLNLLVVFQEMFRHRHVSTVAKHLGLSQPTVSNALARLRRTFNDELFVRTPHGMLPTPYAEELAEPVSYALENVRQALNRSERFDPTTSTRQFVIAMTDVGELHFMPSLVERCSKAAPQVRISAVRLSSINWQEEIGAGRIDLAVGAFTEVPESLYQRRLFSQSYVTMFRRGHPFAGKAVSLAEFLKAQHLLVASQESPYDQINQRLERAGVGKASQFRVPHFTSVPYIVSTTDLVVTVPEKLAQRAAGAFGLAYIRPPLRLPVLRTHIFWHRRFNQDSGNQWLRELIAACFTE